MPQYVAHWTLILQQGTKYTPFTIPTSYCRGAQADPEPIWISQSALPFALLPFVARQAMEQDENFENSLTCFASGPGTLPEDLYHFIDLLCLQSWFSQSKEVFTVKS